MKKIFQSEALITIGCCVIAAIFSAIIFPVNHVFAGVLPSSWDNSVKEVNELVSLKEGDAVDMIKSLSGRIIVLFKYIFAALAILFFTLNLAMMALSAGEEETISKHRKALLWSLLGFGLISVSAQIADVFDPVKNSGDVIANTGEAKTVAQKFIAYMQLSLQIIAIVAMFYAGVRMIIAQGEQEIVDKSKSIFKYGFIGLIVAMLSEPMVNTVIYPDAGKNGVGLQEAGNFSEQLMAVLSFLLTFLAIVLLISFLIAGGMYLTSFGDEERHNTAKQILFGSAIGAIIIFSAYAILTFFIPQ